MDDLHLLLQSTEESDAIKYVADQLGCPLFSKFATKPFGLRAAEKMYALQIAEANDNFAGLDRFNLPKDVRHLLSKTLQVKRLHHGRGMEVVPALKFFQDNDMALNHYTAEACALAVTHRLKEAPFNLFHAGLEHRSLIKNIKNRQLSMPTEDKTHLLSFISGACPGEYNPEDMLIRLTELIFNGITVSSFKDDIFTQGELIFPFFGQASMMHTAPYTEQDHILRIQETRNIHERQLLDRLSTEIKAPLEGFTYAHQVMFAYRAKVGGGVEIMPLGDPAYGQNRLIHKPAITHERVLVMGNITNPTYQHNKPMVITSRESIYLLLATFPRDVLNAYLYFLMHGVFPANAKHCERYKPKEVHCDLTITSLGAAAIPLSHLTQATILFNPSRPLSPEANVLLPFVHRISVDIEHSEIFQSKLSRFYQAIDSDNPVTVKRYVETFAFYTRHITTSGDGIAGYAIRHKKYNAAIELLSQGASPFLSNTEGDTALHLIMRTLPSECPSRIRNRLLIMMFTMAKDQAILLLRNMSGQTAFDEATLPHEVTVALEHNQLFKEVHKFLSLRKSVRLTESCPPARVSEVGLFSHTSLKRGRPPENLEVACAASAERLEDKMTESLSKVAREAR